MIIDRISKKDEFDRGPGKARIEHPLRQYVLPPIADVRVFVRARWT
jgi:hypothetical protein